MRRVNIVGSLPPPIGGTTVLFQELANYIGRRGCDFRIIDLQKVGAMRVLILCFLRDARFSLFNLSSSRIWFLPAIALIAKVTRRSFGVRCFGGSWDVEFSEGGVIQRKLFLWAMRQSEFFCFETKHLVNYFAARASADIEWLPNTRSHVGAGPAAPEKRRFLYIGRVCREKGLDVLAEALEGSDIEVDVYGPVDPDYTLPLTPGLLYKGVLDPSLVVGTMVGYQGLVFPTQWRGEGYPGVILEAFIAGIPVISSRWRSIPELFVDNDTLLITPKDPGALRDALMRVKQGVVNVGEICDRQKQTLKLLQADHWHGRLLALCSGVGQGGAK